MRKESPNGGANQWLANVERRVVLTLALGKEVVKEEASADVTLFIGEGERERRWPQFYTSASGCQRLPVLSGP
jgi:hypothetical protein